MRQLEVFVLCGDVGEVTWRETGGGRDEDFGEVVRFGARGREGLVIFGEGRAGGVKGIRRGEAVDFSACRIQAVYVGGGFLQGGEVDAIGTPVNEVRVFIEIA